MATEQSGAIASILTIHPSGMVSSAEGKEGRKHPHCRVARRRARRGKAPLRSAAGTVTP